MLQGKEALTAEIDSVVVTWQTNVKSSSSPI